MVTVKKTITQDFDIKNQRASGSVCITTKYFLGVRYFKYHETFKEDYLEETKNSIGFKKQ